MVNKEWATSGVNMNQVTEWLDTLDQLRRHQGRALGAMGLGAKESDYRIILARAGLRLRYYGDGSDLADSEESGRNKNATHGGRRPVLLIIPAPIKGPYIWDISLQKSIVRRAKDRGFDTYMVEWAEPGVRESAFGLNDYAGAMINDCIDAITQQSSQGKVFLAGHSLGGTLAALYSAYRPERVAGLVLIESPLRFAEASGAFRKLIETDVPADALLASSDHIPGSMLNVISATAAPETYIFERYLDYFASHRSMGDWHTHWQAIRWTLDELPMSRGLFNEVVERLYRGDQFMRGELVFGPTRLHPEGIKAPLVVVYNPSSRVIPPKSVLDFYHAAGSQSKQLVTYTGDTGVALQHVGVLIGDNAHRNVWPSIFTWMESV